MSAWFPSRIIPATTLIIVIIGIFISGGEGQAAGEEPRSMLMKQECEALAKQPTVKKFYGIHSCKEAWNACDKCNNTAVMRFRGDTVSYLRVPYSPVAGQLPPEWRILKGLYTLHLNLDHLSVSTLPVEWSEMEKLTDLALINGCLHGSLPHEWSALTSLTRLHLQHNEFVGTLPTSWSALSRLKDLDLSGNMIEGTLPSIWSAMTQLTSMRLGRNWLTGNVPASWANLEKLASLDLKHNFLHGSLPEEWSQLRKLASMHLSSNRLSGTIPASWSNMTSLVVLTLGWNRLCGAIPEGAAASAAQHSTDNKWPGAVSSLLSCDLFGLHQIAHAYSSDSQEALEKQRIRGDGMLGGRAWEDTEGLLNEFKLQPATDSPMLNIDPPGAPGRRFWLGRRGRRRLRKWSRVLLPVLFVIGVSTGVVLSCGWHRLSVREFMADLSYRREVLKALLSRSPAKFRADRRG